MFNAIYQTSSWINGRFFPPKQSRPSPEPDPTPEELAARARQYLVNAWDAEWRDDDSQKNFQDLSKEYYAKAIQLLEAGPINNASVTEKAKLYQETGDHKSAKLCMLLITKESWKDFFFELAEFCLALGMQRDAIDYATSAFGGPKKILPAINKFFNASMIFPGNQNIDLDLVIKEAGGLNGLKLLARCYEGIGVNIREGDISLGIYSILRFAEKTPDGISGKNQAKEIADYAIKKKYTKRSDIRIHEENKSEYELQIRDFLENGQFESGRELFQEWIQRSPQHSTLYRLKILHYEYLIETGRYRQVVEKINAINDKGISLDLWMVYLKAIYILHPRGLALYSGFFCLAFPYLKTLKVEINERFDSRPERIRRAKEFLNNKQFDTCMEVIRPLFFDKVQEANEILQEFSQFDVKSNKKFIDLPDARNKVKFMKQFVEENHEPVFLLSKCASETGRAELARQAIVVIVSGYVLIRRYSRNETQYDDRLKAAWLFFAECQIENFPDDAIITYSMILHYTWGYHAKNEVRKIVGQFIDNYAPLRFSEIIFDRQDAEKIIYEKNSWQALFPEFSNKIHDYLLECCEKLVNNILIDIDGTHPIIEQIQIQKILVKIIRFLKCPEIQPAAEPVKAAQKTTNPPNRLMPLTEPNKLSQSDFSSFINNEKIHQPSYNKRYRKPNMPNHAPAPSKYTTSLSHDKFSFPNGLLYLLLALKDLSQKNNSEAKIYLTGSLIASLINGIKIDSCQDFDMVYFYSIEDELNQNIFRDAGFIEIRCPVKDCSLFKKTVQDNEGISHSVDCFCMPVAQELLLSEKNLVDFSARERILTVDSLHLSYEHDKANVCVIHDPLKTGYMDVKDRKLRFCDSKNPAACFKNDPVLILRIFKKMAQGYSLSDPDTVEKAIENWKPGSTHQIDRVWAKFREVMFNPDFSRDFTTLFYRPFRVKYKNLYKKMFYAEKQVSPEESPAAPRLGK